MTDTQALALAIMVTPLALVAIVGLLKSYHLNLRVWRGDGRTDQPKEAHENDAPE